MIIWFDGSCKGRMPSRAQQKNLPKADLANIYSQLKMYCSFVAIDQAGTATVAKVELPVRTIYSVPSSVVSEWYALFLAMRWAKAQGFDNVTIRGDCLSVIENLLDPTIKSKGSMREMASVFYRLLHTMDAVDVEYVGRLENYAGRVNSGDDNNYLKLLLENNLSIKNISVLSNHYWNQPFLNTINPEGEDYLDFLWINPPELIAQERERHRSREEDRKRLKEDKKEQKHEDDEYFASAFGLK